MNNIKDIISHDLEDKEIELIKKAYIFAEKAHMEQKRQSGEDRIDHIFAVAKSIADLNMSAVTISAGLLHGVLDNTNITPEEIEKEFGKEIRFLVEGVNKLGTIKYNGTTKHNESLRKFFVAISKDIRVLIIKLCDRLHNMQILGQMPKEKQINIARETLEIYAPLAHRLGIRKIQRKLEDSSFQYVYPKEYNEINRLLKTKVEEREESLKKFTRSAKSEIVKNNILNFKTDYRIKGIYSLYKKMQRFDMDIKNIYDISAVRIVVPSVEDCYKILGVIHNNWKPLPGKIKDYISSPKPNGYQSLHTTILFGDGSIIEVQIRTEKMHNESEYGVASHIFYKQAMNENKKKPVNPNLLWVKEILPKHNEEGLKGRINLTDVPKWIKELVEYQKEAPDNEFIKEIKDDFLEERIFVFTPKGDVIDLPAKSSVIDFAYAIHSDIGNHISGVKVNNKFTSLDTILEQGDVVEIETKKNAKPSYKWLEFCKTTIAKRHIKNSLDKK